METIVFAGAKGGIGRTTLAVHLAVEYALRGAKVELIDTDSLRCATYWAERTTYPITCNTTAPDRIGPALRRAERDGSELVIVDTSLGLRGRELMALLAHATLVVVPVPPSGYDYIALSAELANIRAANIPVVAVISRARWNDKRVAPMRRALENGGIRVLDTVVHDRAHYTVLSGEGKLARDVATNCKAALEVRALHREIDQLLIAMPASAKSCTARATKRRQEA
ncbi:MAG: ParA family protein [Rhodanobacteraceae bacterium]|nr:MAG: ParA family protein [Rhodanobacteraceae bacterium]